MIVQLHLDGRDCDATAWAWLVSRLTKMAGSDGSGEWKMLTTTTIHTKDSIVPVSPLPAGKLPVKIDVPEGAGRSYVMLGWLLTSKGYSVATDLPGTDDSASVKKMLDELNQRLHKSFCT
jgi:hypothetical protein